MSCLVLSLILLTTINHKVQDRHCYVHYLLFVHYCTKWMRKEDSSKTKTTDNSFFRSSPLSPVTCLRDRCSLIKKYRRVWESSLWWVLVRYSLSTASVTTVMFQETNHTQFTYDSSVRIVCKNESLSNRRHYRTLPYC